MNAIAEYYNTKDECYAPSRLRKQKILELIKEEKKNARILDMGCGAGELGKTLKEHGAYVVGCDIAPHAVEKAKKCLDDAFVFDTQQGDYVSIGKDFDIIIASELVEHLFMPEHFLQNIKKAMRPETKLIITTPNFLVWTNRLRMLAGQFEYTKSGFLDESHIHFFTYRSLKKILQQTGFVIERENHIMHHRIPEWLGKLRPSLFAFQIIIKARLK